MSFGSSFQECWSVNHGSVKMKSTDNLRSSASDGSEEGKGITERKTQKETDIRGENWVTVNTATPQKKVTNTSSPQKKLRKH